MALRVNYGNSNLVVLVVFTLLLSSYCIIEPSTAITIDCPSESEDQAYSFSVSLPIGCSSTSTDDDDRSVCVYTVKLRQNADNESFLDVSITVRASGYGTVGFSMNRRMPDTDVLGCGRNSTGGLHISDSWNPSYYNEIDPNQEGVCPYFISYENGIISCSFSRYAGIINPGFDFNLNETYYLLLAYTDNQNALDNNFPEHSLTSLPQVTNDMVTFFVESNNNSNRSADVSTSGELRQTLIRVHGILMVIAWPFLAVIGIFFAAWTKPSFPNGQWFQFHRALMLCSVLVALIGFMLIFIADKDNTIPGLIEIDSDLYSCPRKLAHLIIGILVTLLQVINPLIGLCRCKPESNRRVIFNLLHGSAIGLITELLALTNVGLGIALFRSNCSPLTAEYNYSLWIYIAWVGFFGLTIAVLFAFSTFSGLYISQDLAPTILKPVLKCLISYPEMTTARKDLLENLNTESRDQFDSSDQTPDPVDKSKIRDSNFRSGALAIFSMVTLIVTVILVVLIAIGGGEDT